MTKTVYSLLYTTDVMKSVAFYEKMLGMPPLEAFPTFASFLLNDGMRLGLWSTSTVAPDVTPAGGSEVALVVKSADDVDAKCAEWTSLGATILQEPTDLVFGRTFLAADPDGHRIRVFNENNPV
ncbi:VOC family protein [Agrobacterium sp. ES01]|uniref:VOC family protein n=1 Tax=Agrobacterium sp. ES01 TaxID=3420714 RepID=UPI003D14D68F